ncbi:hypothetical protein C725_2863 [Pacificimonas flava]|uniref:Uncharacterized protein n=1 Tax=Pacificimonas flava TaxID=1234595 RepID=M2S8R0_9SPHN|nr:hypothetical protein C725_2863 [Pacificimonas flava]
MRSAGSGAETAREPKSGRRNRDPHRDRYQADFGSGHQRHDCTIGPPPFGTDSQHFDHGSNGQADSQEHDQTRDRPVYEPRRFTTADRGAEISGHHDPGIAERRQAAATCCLGRRQTSRLVERKLKHLPGECDKNSEDGDPECGMRTAPFAFKSWRLT